MDLTLTCPYCEKELKRFENIGGEPMTADDRPVLCIYCAELSMTKDQKLRKHTIEDIMNIKYAGLWHLISTDQQKIRVRLQNEKQNKP